jgi:glutamyl-tRNA synthetase
VNCTPVTANKVICPGAFVNMLAFLGWNPGNTTRTFHMNELIASFSIDRVGKAGAKFDPDKTKWFQQQYLRNTPNEELARTVTKRTGHDARPQLSNTSMCNLMKERATFVKDMLWKAITSSTRPTSYDEQTISKKWKEGYADLMREWKNQLALLTTLPPINIEASFKAIP